jgi:DNA polymerase-3 subunit epsilon
MTAGKLSDLEILALDCQATCANPEKGHLLEIGWAATRASQEPGAIPLAVSACLVALPEKTEIPPRVRAVTGITGQDLDGAIDPAEAWGRLSGAARRMVPAGGRGPCVAVVHFARYEEPFLRDLHKRFDPQTPFPFLILCTHEIAKRLLPALPRRGLRALAGYFGRSVPEPRRSADHVAATAWIWHNLVALLMKTTGLDTLESLLSWLAQTDATRSAGRSYPMEPGIRSSLPDEPGVYRMLRSNGDVLYVGKAASLRQRVRSYYHPRARHADHTLEMLSQARGLAVTVTGSALEAALLEVDEIRRLSPPYNIALRGRDRGLRFCTEDLREHAPGPDEHYAIGPLPSTPILEAMAAMQGLLAGDSAPESISRVLGFPGERAESTAYLPEPACFRAGSEMFRAKRREILDRLPFPQSLILLGTRLWSERLESREETPEEPDDQAEDARPAWTPESVARALESVARRGVLLIRRARWFCLLSESSLAWEKRACRNGRRNLVVIEKGALSRCAVLETGQDMPPPPGRGRRFRERQEGFDPAAYDRMRVLTTELRRLVAEGRDVAVLAGRGSVLGRGSLAKALRWV